MTSPTLALACVAPTLAMNVPDAAELGVRDTITVSVAAQRRFPLSGPTERMAVRDVAPSAV